MKVIECDVENSILYEHHNDSDHFYAQGATSSEKVDYSVKLSIPHISFVFSIGKCKTNTTVSFWHILSNKFANIDGTPMTTQQRTYYIDNTFKSYITHPTSYVDFVYYWANIMLIGGWHNNYHAYNIVAHSSSTPTIKQCHVFDLVIPIETQIINTEARSEASGWTIPSRTYNNNYLFSVNHTGILYSLTPYASNTTYTSGIWSPSTSPNPFYGKVIRLSDNVTLTPSLYYNGICYGTQGQTVTTNLSTYPSQAYILLFAKFASFASQSNLSVQLNRDVKPIIYNLFDVIKSKTSLTYQSYVDEIYNNISSLSSYVSKAQASDGSNTIYLNKDSVITKGNYNFYSTYENFMVGVESL